MKIVLLIILSLIILLYIPLNRQIPKFSLKLKIDDRIPFVPWTVWIYYTYYFIFLLSIILTWNTSLAIPLLIAQIVSTAIASLIWKIFPNGVIRPKLENPQTYSQLLLKSHFHYDKDCNGLPSGHVMHSFIACFYLAKLYPQLWALFYIIVMAISFSTLTTKQHYFLDMTTTLAIMPFIIELSSIII